VLIMRATLEGVESWQGPIAHHMFRMSHERGWLICMVCDCNHLLKWWFFHPFALSHYGDYLIIWLKILKAMAILPFFKRKFWHSPWLCSKKLKNKKKLFFPRGDKFKKSFLYQITKGINIKNLIHYPIG